MHSGIREHMEVIGSDGGHLGRVSHVVGDDIELAEVRPDGASNRRLIPVSWVHDIDGDQIRLNLNGGAARAAWREAG